MSIPHHGGAFERVLGRLIDRGWVEAEEGFREFRMELHWTEKGSQQAFDLVPVFARFRLTGRQVSLVQFSREALKARKPHFRDRRSGPSCIWAACLRDLRMAHEEDEAGMRTLIEMVSAFVSSNPDGYFRGISRLPQKVPPN